MTDLTVSRSELLRAITKGPKGDKGDKGDPGKDSIVAGPEGSPGRAGKDGAPGIGIKGDRGPEGPQGAPGKDSTVRGPIGPKGDKGDKGDPGLTPKEKKALLASANRSTGGGPPAVLPIKDEGTVLTDIPQSISFTGAGVTATQNKHNVTVNIPGSADSALTVKDEGVILSAAVDSIDFVGTGVTATSVGNAITVTIPTPASYTDEQAQDAAASLIQNGTGITWVYNDALNTLTPTVTITQYTDELAQDAVGGMIDGTLIYTDGTPLLSRAALTGDVTAPVGSNAMTLQANCCFAHLETDQSVTDGVFTLIKMDTIDIDTQSAYNTGTGKYTPTKAGKYRVCLNMRAFVNTAMSDVIGRILKNGATVSQFTMEAASAGKSYTDTQSGEVIVTMNGTTDYIETNTRVNGTGGGNSVFGSSNTYLVVQYLGA